MAPSATKTRKTTKARRDVAQEVTDLIVGQLEAGVVPWHQPWVATGGQFPRSMSTGREYRGINSLLLGLYAEINGYASPWWGTYRQIEALGGHVNKGEHGSMIVLYRTIEKDEVNDKGEDVIRRIPLMRSFVVFNASQCSDLPVRYTHVETATLTANERRERAEAIVAGYATTVGPRIEHGGDRACYSPRLDLVRVPTLAQFRSTESYYSVMFHELTHSTGHKDRLDREGITEGHRFGDDLYAAEELIAELGAAMLCAIAGIDQTETVPASASYIDNWLTVLKGDTKLVLKAAAAAQRAVDMIAPADDTDEIEAEEVAS